jgi:hypothetical protein
MSDAAGSGGPSARRREGHAVSALEVRERGPARGNAAIGPHQQAAGESPGTTAASITKD